MPFFMPIEFASITPLLLMTESTIAGATAAVSPTRPPFARVESIELFDQQLDPARHVYQAAASGKPRQSYRSWKLATLFRPRPLRPRPGPRALG
jgi:hypothetical protein